MPLLVLAGLAGTPASAAAADYAETARNIIPSGQYGGLPPPPGGRRPGADVRRPHAALRPGHRRRPDHLLQVGGASASTPTGPAPSRRSRGPGVTIVRDRFNVPHVTATTYDGGIWAAGWIAAEDRGLLLQQARYNARVAAIDVPGLSAIGLISQPAELPARAPQTEAERRQADAGPARTPGPRAGRAARHRHLHLRASTPTWRSTAPRRAPWTRNDVYALNALKGQFVGQGGGDEARRSQFLDGLQQRLGKQEGHERLQRPAPVQEPRAARRRSTASSSTGSIPRNAGQRRPRPRQLRARPAVRERRRRRDPDRRPPQASNTLMIDARALGDRAIR